MEKEMKSIVEEIIGKIERMSLLQDQGCTSEVHQVVTEEGSYVLKNSYERKYREWLRNEAGVLEKLNTNTEIPTPNYNGYFEGKNSSHLLMSFEKGVTLTTLLREAKKQELLSLIKSFGQFLQHLHETTATGFHNNQWLVEQLKKAEGYVKSGDADGRCELLQKLILNQPSDVQQTMIHGDCTTDNVMVINGKVRLFIDVAGMTMGDPRYDESLAIRKWLHHEEYIEAFYEGYRRYKVTKQEFEYFNEGLYEFF
ncbi:phosphotransferase family protein [Pseudalkalibacillus hwajinpoensis]|uniref:phosphotransferase family protein n=1 Tax=Guptibacillus hwajinpoensis TaxID=208199 RepID=UPI001CD76B9F|nr:aminoglycoside phosphotransferase family protein [Pseudalkalibacillus hwajinpoensis]MCA0993456.1 aminoglycoside phosphotransferase family protein [Pseudalkalibacillus hwajinpoensis]